MHYFEVWKLATDVLLMCSLIYLGFRFFRSPDSLTHSRQIAELEVTLRALIKEADVAGKTLNDQLVRRQNSLEKLLYDLETSESRLGRTLGSADQRDSALRAAVARAEQLKHSFTGLEQPINSQIKKTSSRQNIEQQLEQEFVPDTRESDDSEPTAPVIDRQPVATSTRKRSTPATNIYGEEIQATSSPVAPAVEDPEMAMPPRSAKHNLYNRARQTQSTAPTSDYAAPIPEPERPRKAVDRYKALASVIEREVDAPKPQKQTAARQTPTSNALKAIYMAAEQLLRSGREIQFVSSKTRLPLNEVERLANKISAESQVQLDQQVEVAQMEEAMAAQPSVTDELIDDPRLGVLAGLKRQTQVL